MPEAQSRDPLAVLFGDLRREASESADEADADLRAERATVTDLDRLASHVQEAWRNSVRLARLATQPTPISEDVNDFCVWFTQLSEHLGRALALPDLESLWDAWPNNRGTTFGACEAGDSALDVAGRFAMRIDLVSRQALGSVRFDRREGQSKIAIDRDVLRLDAAEVNSARRPISPAPELEAWCKEAVKEYARMPGVLALTSFERDALESKIRGEWESAACSASQAVAGAAGERGLLQLSNILPDAMQHFARPPDAAQRSQAAAQEPPGSIFVEQPGGETAFSIGERRYRIGDDTPFVLEVTEDQVLLALIDLGGAASKPQLIEHSDTDDAPRVLRRILQKYPALAPHIKIPGVRGQGGYRTSIRRAE